MTVTLEPFSLDGPVGPLTGYASPAGSGAATPVALVHGINMSAQVWQRLIETLGGDRQFVAVDLRGHGGSTRNGPFTADGYADDVLSVLDQLGVSRAHVVGTSFGGMVAVTLAARVPERVASVTAIGSALAVEGMDLEGATAALRGMGVRPFYEMFLPQASFAPGTPQLLIDEAADIASTNRDVELVIDVSITAFTSDVTAAAEAVQCPALVLAGENDLTCPTPLGEAMAKVLGTELVLVQGRGHMVVVESPQETAVLVQRHLDASE
jgi:3-oxoadipate enol-lactonase